MAITIYKLPLTKTAKITLDFTYWGVVSGLTLVIITARIFYGLKLDQYGNVIVSLISAGLLSLILTPLILNYGNDKNWLRN